MSTITDYITIVITLKGIEIIRQNSLNNDTRQAEDISALQISILAHEIDHDALQSKNNEKLTTFFIWTLQFTILKLHKML